MPLQGRPPGRLGWCSARAVPGHPINPEPETIMQARVRAACRWIGDEQGVTSIEYALLASMFAVAVLGSVVTLKGSLTDTYEVIATAVTAAVTTALAMVS